jgi:hypothetical protein
VRKSRFIAVVVGACLMTVSFAGMATSASADSITQINSFNDFRGDLANKPGTLWRVRYGPYSIPAASGGTPGKIFTNFVVPAPCTGCRITDMVPDLIYAPGTDAGGVPHTGDMYDTANLADGIFLHHFVLAQPGVNDTVCPSNVLAQLAPSYGLSSAEDRFSGAGNERTHVHLPGNYGYTNNASTWFENVHFWNMYPYSRSVYVQVIMRTRPIAATQPVTPLWFDIDGGCGSSGAPGDSFSGDSEYPAPDGYTDYHRSWPVPAGVSGRIVAIGGHTHDIDFAEAGCTTHCPNKGGGYAVTAELNPATASSTYYGPNPATYPFPLPPPAPYPTPPILPTDRTGVTLCRTEGKYGSSVNSTMKAAGHLDTVSTCGVESDLPNGAEPEAYPAGGKYPTGGIQINAGDTIKLHSQYQNQLGFTKPDAMGIMNAWLATRPQTSSGPLRVALVPSFKQCGTGGNSVTGAHKAPLSVGSCAQATTSSSAHVGLLSTGVAMLAPVPDDPGTGPNEADLAMGALITDVRATSASGTDYNPVAGADLTLVTRFRMTDSHNGGSGTDRATLTDFDFGVPLDCATTADTAIGSTCSGDTTVDAISPGAIVVGKQTNVQMFRVRINDPGPNNVLGDSDDKLFEQEGFFAP